jgi:hypothetical protein
MNTAEQILVVTLASALALFLILAIVIAVQTIRLMKQLQTIAATAQSFVDSAEAAADMFKHAAGQVSIMRFAQNVFDTAFKHKHSKDSK